MTDFPFVQIDAFASKPFEGNQACVMPLPAYLPDAQLQAIAAENNVAETAFLVADGAGRWQLRWFTPGTEVPLCGHATLAAAHYLFTSTPFDGDEIEFVTRQSGSLFVSRLGENRYEMDFPAAEIRPGSVSEALNAALGAAPNAAFDGPFLAVQFETPEQVLALQPDLKRVAGIGEGNVGCFALGGADGAAVTSRFFAPGSGIDEDPATGSWHCMLAPILAQLTGRDTARCFQAFPSRGAWIETALAGSRVKLRGNAVTVIEGVFRL